MTNEPSETKERTLGTFLTRLGRGLKAYPTDWKNLLGHALLGVLFVAVAVFTPIPVWLKLVIVVCLVALNVLRMRLKAKRKAETEN